MSGFGRGFLACLLIVAVVLVIVLWHPWQSTANGTNTGTTTGTTRGNTTPGNDTTTNNNTPSSNNTTNGSTTGLSWSDLEAKIKLSPQVSNPATPYANVYHVGDNNSGPYTASCYGNVVFELTGTDGTSYIVACSGNPNVPSFAGATIWDNGKAACTVYHEHVAHVGSAQLVGASC